MPSRPITDAEYSQAKTYQEVVGCSWPAALAAIMS
jgi:hypothetical protein